MNDTATVLARPGIATAIKALIARAMRDGGISQTHTTRVALAMADRVFGGEPVTEAIALVDAVRAGLGVKLDVAQTNNVVEWLDGPSHDGPRADSAIVKITDATGRAIASVNARFLKDLVNYDALPDPGERENGGAGEAGGLLNA